VKHEALPPFERTLTRLMRAGMWISSVLLAAGLAVFLLAGVSSGEDALIRAGLLTLMATPVLRIVLSIVEAVRLNDRFWLWSTLAVVMVLAGTLLYSLKTAG
jgi:uncharacterized membrane protein